MKGNRFTVAIVACLCLSSMAGVANAHHSFAAEYDINKPITLEGVLTKMEWLNPHGWIHIDVKGPDGQTRSWAIEAGGTAQLIRRGMKKEDFPVGTELKIKGYQARDGSLTANGQSVTMKDGRNFFMGSITTPGAPDAR